MLNQWVEKATVIARVSFVVHFALELLLSYFSSGCGHSLRFDASDLILLVAGQLFVRLSFVVYFLEIYSGECGNCKFEEGIVIRLVQLQHFQGFLG